MHALSYDYALIRVVPRVERAEYVNAGVILFCRTGGFLGARIALDESRLLALAPDIDIDGVNRRLEHIELICQGGDKAGPIGSLSIAERFHWLVAPRSTVIQTSPVHTGLCSDPEAALEHLVQTMVREEKMIKGMRDNGTK